MAKKNRKKILRINKKIIQGKIAFYLLLGVILLGAAMLAGLFGFKVSESTPTSLTATLLCCDSGNGDACKPETGSGQTLTFNGESYGLLRSTVQFVEGNLHLQDTGQNAPGTTNPIIVNSSQDHAVNNVQANTACNRPNPLSDKKDLYFKKNPPDPYMFMKTGYTYSDLQNYCTSIPDDEIIFVCKKNCSAAACSFSDSDPTIKCYGTPNTVYDTYFRLKDQQTPGIPDFIKNCDKTGITQPTGPIVQKIVTPSGTSPNGQNSLQLKTFGFSAEASVNPWLSPLCKPAIYLYPPKETEVHVNIAPKGKTTLTIPTYPKTGWDVLANPDGKIISGGITYPYLYYEAQIPNEKVDNQANTGFVVPDSKLKSFFDETLPKLGLNQKETTDFSNYWVKALPSSPFYKITLVPETILSELAPLTISPKPDTVIRLTMYFTPLDKKVALPAPQLSQVSRNGFTVVEWGGLFKKDKNHQFTCLM